MNFAKYLTASAMSVYVVQVTLLVILVNRHLSNGLHAFPNCLMILKYPKEGHINLKYEKGVALSFLFRAEKTKFALDIKFRVEVTPLN